MKTVIRQNLLMLILLITCCNPAFSQDNYYMNKAKDYMRDAEYYTRKAEDYDREAAYYNNKAQDYLREADYYSRHKNQDKAKELDNGNVYVKSIKVDEGRTLKRIRPCPQGRAGRIRKRSNHVTVILDVKQPVENK